MGWWGGVQGSKFKFEFGSTCATRCKFLGRTAKILSAQLKILGAQLMLGASISNKRKSKVLLVIFSLFFYFSPVIDKTQPICYAVIPL